MSRGRLDWPVVLLVFAVHGAGLAALYSAGGEGYFFQQLRWSALGVVVMAALALAPPRWLENAAPFIFAAGLASLAAVLLVGLEINNARRWLDVGVRVQPSELMKVAAPMALGFFYAKLPARNKDAPPHILHHLLAGALAAVPALMVLRQPDLGTAVMIFAAGVSVIFFAGIGWRWVAAAGAGALAFLPVAWYFILKPYQQKRILTLIDPQQDPLGAGYHTIQSEIAVGSGGMWGKGFAQGTQAQLGFLPERHTDFIFAVFAEEFGWAGAGALLGLYVLLIFRCLQLAARARRPFARLAAGGIVAAFALTMFVNLGMVSGLMPVVGMPLPLVSYGGTALVATFAGFGVIQSITAPPPSTPSSAPV